MSSTERLAGVVETERVNAALGWALVGFVVLVSVASFVRGDLLWTGFALVVATLALVPTVAHRRLTVMLPWEVLALAALPLIGRVFATVPLTSRFATYLAVAAIALIIAVELHIFTPVLMTPSFAVLFVVVATMATAGIWAVVRWTLDITLNTHFLLDPTLSEHQIENRLMWEFVYSTAAGVLAGGIFELYFRRRAHIDDRLPEGMEVVEP